MRVAVMARFQRQDKIFEAAAVMEPRWVAGQWMSALLVVLADWLTDHGNFGVQEGIAKENGTCKGQQEKVDRGKARMLGLHFVTL